MTKAGVTSPLNVFDRYRRGTVAALARLVGEGVLPSGLDLGRFSAEPPSAGKACDIVIDAALVYAHAIAASGTAPLELACSIARHLSADPCSASVEVAGRGFVNVALRPSCVLDSVATLLRTLTPAGRFRAADPADPDDLPPLAGLDEARTSVMVAQIAALSAAAGRTGPDGSWRSAFGSTVMGHGPAGEGREAGRADGALTSLDAPSFRFAVASCPPPAVLRLDALVPSERSRDNPVFWVRYAHARLRGVVRRAASAFPDLDVTPSALGGADLSALTDPGETHLARLLIRHPHVIDGAAAAMAPRRLAGFLIEVADAVHSQWNTSKDQPQLRFVNEEQRDLTRARLGLVTASTLVLDCGLGILGITAPDEMR